MQHFTALEDKIKTLDELVIIREAAKQAGKSVVTNNGSYDIMHLGHVLGLCEAKAQGDVLIIGLNSDKSVRAYKGESRPINDQRMRARMLASHMCVDYVFLFDETEPMSWLAKLQPDVHTNGAEYGHQCIEQETVISCGGRLHLLAMTDGYKTSHIIEKIKHNW